MASSSIASGAALAGAPCARQDSVRRLDASLSCCQKRVTARPPRHLLQCLAPPHPGRRSPNDRRTAAASRRQPLPVGGGVPLIDKGLVIGAIGAPGMQSLQDAQVDATGGRALGE
ncbi:MAG TPA: heme-binding protein [Polyangia bacterium]|nr:heme-binding protein [Polyangia bacterium]